MPTLRSGDVATILLLAAFMAGAASFLTLGAQGIGINSLKGRAVRSKNLYASEKSDSEYAVPGDVERAILVAYHAYEPERLTVHELDHSTSLYFYPISQVDFAVKRNKDFFSVRLSPKPIRSSIPIIDDGVPITYKIRTKDFKIVDTAYQ